MLEHLEDLIQAEAIRSRTNPVQPARWWADTWLRTTTLREAQGAPTGPVPSLDQKHASPANARANYGRWIVDCPAQCGGAAHATEAFPYFICVYCGSEGKWYDVRFPKNKRAIDTELMLRRHPANRNWERGTSLATLKREREENEG